MKLTELFVRAGLCSSNTQAMNLAKQGGLQMLDPLGIQPTYRVDPSDEMFSHVSEDDIADVIDVPQVRDEVNSRTLLKLRVGKKHVAFVAVTD